MYPLHTGSVLLDIAHARNNDIVRDGSHRRVVKATRDRAGMPLTDAVKRPWWWGLARRQRAA